MHRRRLALVVPIVTALALAAGAASAVSSTPTPDAVAALPTSPATQPDLAVGVIVKLADDPGDTDVADLADEVASALPDGVGVTGTSEGTADLGVLNLSDAVPTDTLDDTLDALEADPAVEWAAPNGWRYPADTATDPDYTGGYLWNLNGAWGVQANSAWDVTKGSPAVRVAVVDTGVRWDHPDLAGQLVAGYDFVDDEYYCRDKACSKVTYRRTFINAADGSSWDGDATDPGDWHSPGTCSAADPGGQSTWHGTHVAGIIAARRNNGIGVVGVAPETRVQPVRVLGRCGGTDWDIAMGLLWASGANVRSYDTRHGAIPVNPTPAQVINLSLGYAESNAATAQRACRLYGQVAAVARSRGATVVAAAGNDGRPGDVAVPASCPGFISVAATTPTGARAGYSNYGPAVDVAGPGGVQDGGAFQGILSTSNNGVSSPGANVYGYLSGTSMAAPAVSASAALAYAVGISNPDVVERVLASTARRSSCSAAECGAGVVSAANVVRAKAPITGPGLAGAPHPGSLLTASPGIWRNTTAVGLAWYRNGQFIGAAPSYRTTRGDIGKVISVRATAADGLPGIYSEAAVVVKWKSKTRYAMASKVKKSSRAKLTVKVVSRPRPQGVVRVYDGSRRIAAKKVYAKNRGKVTITLPKLRKGKHRIRVVYSGNAKVASSVSRTKIVRSR